MRNVKNYKNLSSFIIIFLLIPLLWDAKAQEQTYENLQEALFSTSQLIGDTGPQSINWIEDGERFSFIESSLQC